MKKTILMTAIMLIVATLAFAQKDASPAKITFPDGITHDFGDFSESNAIQKCTFTFRNVGGQPLVINQVMASCGCTVAEYTKTPIAPGETGTIAVTYNGKGKFPGAFKKTITVRTNGAVEMTRLYIKGNMHEDK